MKILIHDLTAQEFGSLYPQLNEDITVIQNDAEIHNCIGCFGCWIKTPASCIIKDSYKDMGKLISQSEELIIISRCYYGGYSPYVKNVLDRSISFMLPYFDIRNGEMHHKSRYSKKIKFTVCFYGEDITNDEKQTASEIVTANSMNLNLKESSVKFYRDYNDMKGEILWK